MAKIENPPLQQGSADGRRDYWMQQYAAAFMSGDRRSAAVALQFAGQYNRTVIVANPKPKQQLG
jgi:hypothetical protein